MLNQLEDKIWKHRDLHSHQPTEIIMLNHRASTNSKATTREASARTHTQHPSKDRDSNQYHRVHTAVRTISSHKPTMVHVSSRTTTTSRAAANKDTTRSRPLQSQFSSVSASIECEVKLIKNSQELWQIVNWKSSESKSILSAPRERISKLRNPIQIYSKEK